jgi:hypothetical protein
MAGPGGNGIKVLLCGAEEKSTTLTSVGKHGQKMQTEKHGNGGQTTVKTWSPMRDCWLGAAMRR